MTHEQSPKHWVPRYEEWLSVEELEYRRMQALDSELVIRETPYHKMLENWAALRARGN